MNSIRLEKHAQYQLKMNIIFKNWPVDNSNLNKGIMDTYIRKVKLSVFRIKKAVDRIEEVDVRSKKKV